MRHVWRNRAPSDGVDGGGSSNRVRTYRTSPRRPNRDRRLTWTPAPPLIAGNVADVANTSATSAMCTRTTPAPIVTYGRTRGVRHGLITTFPLAVVTRLD